MELKLLSLSEDDKLIRECMEQASAFYGCLGKMGVTEILCDRKKAQELGGRLPDNRNVYRWGADRICLCF